MRVYKVRLQGLNRLTVINSSTPEAAALFWAGKAPRSMWTNGPMALEVIDEHEMVHVFEIRARTTFEVTRV